MDKPWVDNDLPAGGKRLLQSSTHYRATFKSGAQTFNNGTYLLETPGILIRGPQASPAADDALKAAS